MVGSQWRKYDESLIESGLNDSGILILIFKYQLCIEENSIGSESKSPYVVPPGIPRDIDNTTIVQRRTNEQCNYV